MIFLFHQGGNTRKFFPFEERCQETIMGDVLNEGDQEGRQEPAAPVEFDALLQLIAARAPTMPKRLRQVAEAALNDPREFAFSTMTGIAERTGVQPSALARFAQTLGFPGFSALQTIFRGHARDRWPGYRERLESLQKQGDGQDVRALLAGFAEAAAVSVQRVTAMIDASAVERAAILVAGSETVYVTGVRRAFPAASYLSYALRRLKVRCELVDHVGGSAADQVAMLGRRDVLLAISFTPYNPSIQELAASAAALGVKLIAITDSPFSPLVPRADVWIEVVEANYADFRSLAGTFVVASALAVRIAELRSGPTDNGI